jgi:alanyl-tRNA synthetase
VLNEFFKLSGVRPPSESAHPEVMAEHARLAGMMSVSTTSKLLEQRKGLVKRLGEKGIRLSLEELMTMLVPFENVFALADHCRCILLMLSDGIVPSNVKAGYLARLVIRKALRTMEELKLEANLADLVLLHLRTTQGIVKLGESEGVLRTMLDLEVKRYHETTEKGARMVRRIAKESKGVISIDKLIELYDTHGIHPTVVQAAALAEGINLEVPDAFSALVASRHVAEKKEAVVTLELPPDIPQTKALYYEHPTMRHFTAKVTHVRHEEEHEQVVLDRSAFYPEGGGQHADKGSVESAGRTVHIEDIQKYDGRILITLEKPLGLKVGDEVRCEVDWRTRMAHSRHHTATHIIIGSTRKVLGPHVWQAGAEKSEKGAHVDISHYDRVSLDQLHAIEREANEIVAANLPVEHLSLPREEAEKRFGLVLYQGGAPAGPMIRVIRVGDFDSEACGGTHTSTSGEVGLIKITRAERIQDGVVRLEYSASMAALHHIQLMERIIHESAQELSVQPDQLPKTVKRFFEEWKGLKKEVEALRARAAKEMASSLRKDAEKMGNYGLVLSRSELDIDLARQLSVAITSTEPRFVCVIPSCDSGNLIISSGKEVALNLGDVARDVAKEFGGSGGGKGNFAQIGNLATGPGQQTHKADMAASRAAELIRALLAEK